MEEDSGGRQHFNQALGWHLCSPDFLVHFENLGQQRRLTTFVLSGITPWHVYGCVCMEPSKLCQLYHALSLIDYNSHESTIRPNK